MQARLVTASPGQALSTDGSIGEDSAIDTDHTRVDKSTTGSCCNHEGVRLPGKPPLLGTEPMAACWSVGSVNTPAPDRPSAAFPLPHVAAEGASSGIGVGKGETRSLSVGSNPGSGSACNCAKANVNSQARSMDASGSSSAPKTRTFMSSLIGSAAALMGTVAVAVGGIGGACAMGSARSMRRILTLMCLLFSCMAVAYLQVLNAGVAPASVSHHLREQPHQPLHEIRRAQLLGSRKQVPSQETSSVKSAREAVGISEDSAFIAHAREGRKHLSRRRPTAYGVKHQNQPRGTAPRTPQGTVHAATVVDASYLKAHPESARQRPGR